MQNGLHDQSEAQVTINLRFKSSVQSDTLFFDIFGDYLSNVFPESSKATIDSLANALLNTMKKGVNGRYRLVAGDELMLTVMDKQTVMVSRDDVIRKVVIEQQTMEKLLDFFLGPTRNVGIDTIRTVRDLMSTI
jgi:hypothetical protein